MTQTQTAHDFCHELVEAAVASDLSMVRHPFVRRVAEGAATVEQVREFGTGMYRLVLDAQRWTAAGYAQIDDQSVRARLLGSMYEEETGNLTGTASHAELVAAFVAALGQPEDETRRAGPPAAAALPGLLRLPGVPRSVPAVLALPGRHQPGR